MLDRWSPKALLFFHILKKCLALLKVTGVSSLLNLFDRIDPSNYPFWVGPTSKHQANFYGIQLTKEYTLLNVKTQDLLSFRRKKSDWLRGHPRQEIHQIGTKVSFLFCFLKSQDNWQGEMNI
jgi:hypothetical protein